MLPSVLPRKSPCEGEGRRKCCVSGCNNKERNNPDRTLSFHKFPKEENLRKQWLLKIGRVSVKQFTQATRVCSEHFKTTDFIRAWRGMRRHLKKDAVPSVFKCSQPQDIRKSHGEMSPLDQSDSGRTQRPDQMTSQASQPAYHPQADFQDHDYSAPPKDVCPIDLSVTGSAPSSDKMARQPVHFPQFDCPDHDYSAPPREVCPLRRSAARTALCPDQAAYQASQAVHEPQPSVCTQMADPDHDHGVASASVEDQLEKALQRIAELEALLARERAAPVSWSGLQPTVPKSRSAQQ